jgi:arabinofuranosyltransferase
MLLIPLFCGLLPVSAVPVHGKRWIVGAGVIAWAALCAAMLRVPYSGIGDEGIADERGFYAGFAGRANPVTSDDYLDCGWGKAGTIFSGLDRDGRRTLVLNIFAHPAKLAPLRADARATVYAEIPSIGVAGFVAGTDVYIIDQAGLADPLVGRAEISARGRPGHEKRLDDVWTIARYAPEDFTVSDEEIERRLRLAREALECPPLRELQDAVSAPMTLTRFIENLRAAPKLTALRIPNDPGAAVASLCAGAARRVQGLRRGRAGGDHGPWYRL